MVTVSDINNEFDRYFDKGNDELEIDLIFVSGSIVRNQFFPGWSDVDIVIVANELSITTLSIINKWCKKLTEKAECKVGMDFVYSKRLDVSEYRKIKDCLEFIKNFHVDNMGQLDKGIIYKKSGYIIPSIPENLFIGVEASRYYEDLREQVNETFMRNNFTDDHKEAIYTLRIVTKACLYIMQTHRLVTNGKLFTEYSILPQATSSIIETETSAVFKVYENAKNGLLQNLSLKELSSLLVKAKECFDNLITEVVNNKNKMK
jgi:predicted nucleotidyltransferase